VINQGQQPLHVAHCDRHTALGGCVAGAGKMEENRTATLLYGWPVIPADFDHHIIEVIVAPHGFVACGERQGHGPVVAPVSGGIAPAVLPGCAPQGQVAQRPRSVISTPPDAPERKPPGGCAAIPFTFGARDAAFAQSAAKHEGTRSQPTFPPVAGQGANLDCGNPIPDHVWSQERQLCVTALPLLKNLSIMAASIYEGLPPDFRMSNVRRILLVDDDNELRGLLAEQLALHDEFGVVQAQTATEGVHAVRGDHVDLVLMDVGLPDMDGREAVRLMRKQGFKSPIIMLTANDTEADTVLGLDAGANDYVTKPFRFAVLLARIRAHLRQYEASEDAQFNLGPYVFRPGAKVLMTEKGTKIRLTEKETSILRYLYRAGQRVVQRDVLLQEVWGYNAAVTTHTLETHVYRLRQKIETDPANARILVTDAGGYKLVP
jgi:DNA-binding response OmpR family regulator